jgi:uncharacterized protein with PIN domain
MICPNKCSGFLEFVDKKFIKVKREYEEHYWRCNKCGKRFNSEREEIDADKQSK